jgi:hypothetical protein
LAFRPPSKFDWSLPLLIFIASSLLWILARFETISSFDFQGKGFILDFKYALAYCVIATLIIIPAFYILDGIQYFYWVLSFIIGFSTSYFFYNEIFSLFLKKTSFF